MTLDFTIIFIGIGLIFGSFFNVVIHRLPELLDHNLSKKSPKKSLLTHLSFPRSHCTLCRHSISWFDNIPLFSWLLLLGKCRYCRASISPFYIVVELITMLIFTYSYWHYGLTADTFVWIAFFSILTLLFFIDLQSFYLPDTLTYTLIGFGLCFSYFGLTGIDFIPSIIGGISGFCSFFFVNLIYKLWRKRDGFGGGDMKLLAGFGCWLGWVSLLPIVMISSVLAIAFTGIMLALGKRYKMTTMLPFGPFLVLSGIILYADKYLHLIPYVRFYL